MSGKHVILLVEDDTAVAADIKEILESAGYRCEPVGNQQEAELLIDKGDFCLVILDRNIRVRPGGIPRIVAGDAVLDCARRQFPEYDSDRVHHLLKILMMSGEAKQMDDVRAVLMDSRADDFIVKPLQDNRPSFLEKVATHLAASGRNDHSRCKRITERARGPEQVPAIELEEEGDAESTLEIRITGDEKGEKNGIFVDARPLFLPEALFILLLRFVFARCGNGKKGYVHLSELGEESTTRKKISRLRKAIADSVPGGPPDTGVLESDDHGSYRLAVGVRVRVSWAKLESHSNAFVREIAERGGVLSRR